MKTENERLLDTLVKERIRATLDIVLRSDQYYQSTITEQDKAFEQLDKIGLSKQQKTDVE